MGAPFWNSKTVQGRLKFGHIRKWGTTNLPMVSTVLSVRFQAPLSLMCLVPSILSVNTAERRIEGACTVPKNS